METLKDVLLYLARHVPAGHAELAAMERIIGEAFEPLES
jgi:Flp pilus assembly protein TadB